jgi:hypothetical protein
MAGQPAGVNFDRNDPIFNNLDPGVQAHLNGLLTQQVAAARQVQEHRINSTNIRHVTQMAHVSNRVSDSISYSWSAAQASNHAPETVGRKMDMARVKCNVM